TPAPGPRIESSRLVEKIAGTCPCPGSALGLCASFGSGAPDQLITERAKSKRKVGSLLGHDPQQIEREGHILLSRLGQPDLVTPPGLDRELETAGKRFNHLRGERSGD